MPWDKVQHLRGSEGYWLVIIKGPRILWFNYSRWSMRYPLVNLQKVYMENHHFLYNGYINYMWAIINSYVKLPEGSRLAISPGELVYVAKLQNNSLSKVWTSSRHSGVTSPGCATRSAIYYKMKLLNRCKQPYHPSFILMFILWWAKSRLGQVGESPHKIINELGFRCQETKALPPRHSRRPVWGDSKGASSWLLKCDGTNMIIIIHIIYIYTSEWLILVHQLETMSSGK
jgi:hypothetical protein